MLLLALDDNAGASERLLQSGDDFILQSEKGDAIPTEPGELFGDVAHARWMQHVGVLKVEFSRFGGEKQLKVGLRSSQQLLWDASQRDSKKARSARRHSKRSIT